MSLHRRVIGFVMLLGFLSNMSAEAVVPVLSLAAKAMGASSFVIGLIFGSLYAVRFIVGPPIGALSDRLGLARLLIAGLLATPLVPGVYIFSATPAWLLIGRLLHGAISSTFTPLVMAYLGTVTPHNRIGLVAGLYNTTTWVSSAVGVLLGGILADRLGLRAPFLLFLVVSLVTPALGLGLPDDRRFAKVPPLGESTRSRDAEPRISAYTYLIDPFTAGLLVTTSAHSMIQAVLFTFFPLLGAARGYSLTEIGAVLSVVRIAASVLQTPCGLLADRVPPSRVLLVGAVTLCAGIGLFLSTPSLVYTLLSAIVLGAGFAAMLAALTASAIHKGHDLSMGVSMGIFYSSQALGRMVGPVVAGLALPAGGYALAFVPTALLALLGAIIVRAVSRRTVR